MLMILLNRGTNNTLLFDCYASDAARALAPTPPAGNASDTASDTIWADATVFDATCAVNQNETGQFVGTAFTARDILAVVDALGEDGMVRYWGISYGTLLGATLAAMFPDKVDKVLLDGVVNAHEYYQNKSVSDTVLRWISTDSLRLVKCRCTTMWTGCSTRCWLNALQTQHYAHWHKARMLLHYRQTCMPFSKT